MYLPMVSEARNVSNYALGPYFVSVFTDCKSQGMIEYEHVVMVYRFDKDTKKPVPVMAVAAEIASALKQIRLDNDQGMGYFLGVFNGSGHLNLGMSADWGDLDKFKQRALAVIREHLKVKDEPQLLTNLN
ncbi:MAG: hypothetical protein OHK0046_03350 [Anaerolineae bacterium]